MASNASDTSRTGFTGADEDSGFHSVTLSQIGFTMSVDPSNCRETPGFVSLRTGSVRFEVTLAVVAGIALLILVNEVLIKSQGLNRRGRRPPCHNQLRQIALALINYEAIYGTYPPIQQQNLEGETRTWRHVLLPYMEDSNFTADDDRVLDYYQCPDSKNSPRRNIYVALTGIDTFWQGPVAPSVSRYFPVVVEINVQGEDLSDFLYVELDEVRQSSDLRQAMFRSHNGSTYVSFADGSVRCLTENEFVELISPDANP